MNLHSQENYTERYCLDFYNDNYDFNGWIKDGANSFSILPEGWSETFPKGKNTLKVESMDDYSGSYINKLSVRLMSKKNVLLPNNLPTASKIRFLLTCKSLNLKQLDLLILEYNKKEQLLRIDTLNAMCEDSLWHVFKTEERFLGETTFLGFRIFAEGKDSTYNRKREDDIRSKFVSYGHKDSVLNECLYLYKLDIYINDKHIDSFPLNEPEAPVFIPAQNIVRLSFEDGNCFNGIQDLSKHHIIGIGETIHGSETMAKSTVDLIKHQVEYNNCKLILLEKLSEEVLILNRFVQGDANIEIDDILENFNNPRGNLINFFSSNQLKELCLWLRKYNKKSDKKVWLLGVDYEPFGNWSCRIAICDYLSRINEKIRNKTIAAICDSLLSVTFVEQFKISELYVNLDKEKGAIIDYIGDKEFEIFRYNLQNIWTERTHESLRDAMMARNVAFYDSLLCEKEESVVVQAHSGHTDYTHGYTYPTMGSLLKDKYGEEYFNIDEVAAIGSCFISEETELIPPVEKSIEKYLDMVGENYFYSSTSNIDNYVLIRNIGTRVLSEDGQYHNGYISLSGRMDGIIFIKNIMPIAAFHGQQNYEYKRALKFRDRIYNTEGYDFWRLKKIFLCFLCIIVALSLIRYIIKKKGSK